MSGEQIVEEHVIKLTTTTNGRGEAFATYLRVALPSPMDSPCFSVESRTSALPIEVVHRGQRWVITDGEVAIFEVRPVWPRWLHRLWFFLGLSWPLRWERAQ